MRSASASIPGSMGRPLPGYRVVLLDHDGLEADHGEIAIPLDPRPLGLMRGYQDDDGALQPIEGEHYRTGDVATRDAEGYITYVGRADDVFKSSDYRLSPFELESALIEHPAVAEAAVVPAPDAARLNVAKAYVDAGRAAIAPTVRRRCRSSVPQRAPGALQAHPPHRIRASCRRRSRARSAASNCASAKRSAPRRRRARRARVPHRGVPEGLA